MHNYVSQEYRRKLTVKLKNSIMAVWLDVKKSRYKPSFEEIIKELIKKKSDDGREGENANETKKAVRKERR